MTGRARRLAAHPNSDARLAALFVAPALATIAAVVGFPLLWAIWESLHHHDLRMPWLGRPFVGLANYREAFADPAFWSALRHTVGFTVATVGLELAIGLALALALNGARRGIGALRTAALLPWAVPTVVAALVWRFMFESRGVVNRLLVESGLLATAPVWFADPRAAWIPIVVADVWKTTPFMALLLLAGLQGIDPALYEAAALDGAGVLRQTFAITLPLLRPAIVAAVVFRSLDAFRVFDVVYVMTRGGPGTATEPLSLYVFAALFRDLRFGYGSAVALAMFLVSFAMALGWLRAARRQVWAE